MSSHTTSGGPGMVSATSMTSFSSGHQLLAQQLVHEAWVCLPFRLLHDLSDQESDRIDLARSHLVCRVGVLRYDLIDRRTDRALVAYLAQPLGLRDRVGGF